MSSPDIAAISCDIERSEETTSVGPDPTGGAVSVTWKVIGAPAETASRAARVTAAPMVSRSGAGTNSFGRTPAIGERKRAGCR